MPKETPLNPEQLEGRLHIASALIVQKSPRKIPIVALEVQVPFINPVKKPIEFSVSFIYTGIAAGKHRGNKVVFVKTPLTTNSQNETFLIKREIHYISWPFNIEVSAQTLDGEVITHLIDGDTILRLLPNRD